MEPWDGPAGLIFTDGFRVGASLDRNGLRPLRTFVCDDGLIAVGSEAGAVSLRGHGRVKRGKLGPGDMIFVDPADGGFQEDPVRRIAAQRPFGLWLSEDRADASAGDPQVEIPDELPPPHVTQRAAPAATPPPRRPSYQNANEP